MDARSNDAKGIELTLDEGFFTTRDGLRLYWRSVAPRDGSLVRAHLAVVHGYGEHVGRYRETMERLANAGFASLACDFRGHGQSQGVRAHVDRFEDYLADLDELVSQTSARAKGKKLFALGHSLGGLILARWSLGKKDGVAGLMLSSPFLGLAFQPPRVKLLGAKVLTYLAPRLHLGNELKIDELTHDPVIRRATAADPLYQHVTTAGWFRQTTGAQAETLSRARELTLPCLVLVGDADRIADPAGGRRLFESAGSADKDFKSYPGLFHELLNEIDRDKVFADILDWLSRHL
jgi:alpha-beta hydrolase superfamily lysophospholipase